MPDPQSRVPPPGLRPIRDAVLFMAAVLALSLVRFFQAILTPLVVAMFLMVLIDAVSRVLQRRLPGAPDWVRGGIAGAIILIGFAAIGGLFVLEAPPFASQIHGLEPKIDAVLDQVTSMVGIAPITLRQIFSGVDPSHLLARVFATARGLISYGVLVVIYLGFLMASRVTFGKKVDSLYQTEAHRAAARRVTGAVRDAVERYVRLQTLKALMMAAVAFGLMAVMGVQHALFIAFLVFLSAYVPVIGPVVGSLFPGLMALAQFDDLARPAILIVVIGTAVSLIDNVLMPKLQSDALNLDPLLVLISIGFWGAILGMPGVLLATPLTVTLMALTAEFEATRWMAVLISRDGRPGHGGEGLGVRG